MPQNHFPVLATLACLQPALAQNPAPRFERVDPPSAGIHFRTDVAADHPLARLYHAGFSAGAVAIGDVDGDGRPDLFFAAGPEDNALYRQTAPFEFDDITARSGVAGAGRWSAGACLVDIDDDGDLDLYVCNYDSENQLFVNDGSGVFAERAAEFGVDLVDSCVNATFGDYDRDGDLDLYVVTYRYYREGGKPATAPIEMVDGVPHIVDDEQKHYRVAENPRPPGSDEHPGYRLRTYGRHDYLLRNDGGRFTDVTEAAGVQHEGFGLSATWWDYDEDGWPDLYVCNDFDGPDKLFRNHGDGTFSDVLVDVVPHTTWFSMGSAAGDLNNDGHIDLLATDMSATTHFMQKTTMGAMNVAKLKSVAGPPPQYMRNTVYLNTGTGRMLEAAYLLGLADSDWSWCVQLGDLDNDGWTDAFITNGMTRSFNDSDFAFREDMLIGRTHWDVYRDTPPRREQNLAFRNTGDLGFDDASAEWGLAHVGISFGAAQGDLDGDGDLDLVVGNLDEPPSLYRNTTDTENKDWVGLRLRGTRSNRFGLGTRIEIEHAGGRQVRVLTPYMLHGSNQPVVHFGLGKVEGLVRARLSWPSGIVQELADLGVCQFHTVEEAGEPVEVARAAATPWLAPSTALADVRHEETEFDDFRLQPLLPNQLSQLGPGMAWGDIDGDGDDDVYVGGAGGQAGQLRRNLGDGKFEAVRCFELRRSERCEDMGALFFDADSDGDQDLFVVSGGVEIPPGLPFLSDRLYINDGTGNFASAPRGSLPRATDSGSVVCAADFDRDGDLDLFVGGRVVRGEYPLAANSRLLRNDGGRFTEVDGTPETLRRAGLVTSALWSDVDADGWCDLLVTLEWGPVRLFRNRDGTLADGTNEAGLARHTGWWNGIAGRDLDGDGDIDYVVTNNGYNTKYHASNEHPALLYYGDFEGNGVKRLVEAEFEQDHLFPVRGRSCSTHAMPSLGEKISSYREFALANLSEIYTEQCLDDAVRLAATTLASSVLRNDGAGRFTVEPLPRLAQISPGFGVVVTELNGDVHPDVVLAQNFFTPQAETGRFDSGLGLVLRGTESGLAPMWPAESGLSVPGDAKALTTADLDGDGALDLVITVNDGPVVAFASRAGTGGSVTVDLQGAAGNLDAAGSRVTLRLADGRTQTAEVYAGGGYLSQSSSTLAFGTGGAAVEGIDVTWPDGSRSSTAGAAGVHHYRITQP